MRRTRAENNAASRPAVVNESTPGYYVNRDVGGGVAGTVVDADELNIIQEEIATAITEAGISLDDTGADVGQLSDAMKLYVASLKSSATAAVGTTTHLRAVLASTAGDAEGADSAVIASDTGYASGADSAVLASDHGSTAGARTAIIASEQVTALSNQIAAASSNAAIVACVSSNISDGVQALVAASDGADIGDGVTNSAVVATSGSCAMATSGSGNFIACANDAIIAASSHSAVIGAGNGTTSIGAGCDSSAIIATGGVGAAAYIDGSSSVAVLASEGGHISAGGTSASGSQTSAVIAAEGSALEGTSRSLVAASYNSSIKENLAQSAIIGCVESTMPITTTSATVGLVMLASSYCDAGAAVDPPNYSVFGGYHASSLVHSSWRIESNGGHFRGADYLTTGLDYAELFPNADGSAHPVGSFVSRTGKAATLNPGRFLGIVSAAPSIVGGDDGLGWAGRELRDEFGALVMEVDANGERVAKRNPEYDPTRPQVARRDRPAEWTCVGLLGQLRARVAENVAVDDFIAPGPGGVGVAVDRETRCECMEIVVPFDAEKGYAVALVLVR